MKRTSPRVRSLLRQAERTAQTGKRAAAHQLYEEILDEAPDTVAAWIGLAETTTEPAQQEKAYRRALALEPENAQARAALGLEQATVSVREQDAPSAPPNLDIKDQVDGHRALAPPDLSAPTVNDVGDAQDRVEHSAVKPTDQVDVPEFVEEGDEMLACYRHPGRETGLRCITCNRPICMQCARHTPVGYRCPQCIREAQEVFFTAGIVDYAVAGVVSFVLGLIAGFLVPLLGFFVIFIGPAVGTFIGRIAFRAARRRHGRWLPYLVAAMVALGGLLPRALPILLSLLLGGGGSLLSLLWPMVYVFLATGTAYYQVK